MIFSLVLVHHQHAFVTFFVIHVCCTISRAAAEAQTSALHIAAYFGVGLYVCHRDTLSSLSPRKTEILPLHLALPLSLYPPISLRLHPALIRPCSHAGKMTERGKRGWRGRERGEKEMTAPQQVLEHQERREGGRKRGECYSDDELLTMGDICSIKRRLSWVKHAPVHRSVFTHTFWVNCLCLPSIWIAESLHCLLPWLTPQTV